MNYEELLERAKKHMPSEVSARKRFEMPQVKSFIEGNRTIITNFTNMADYLNRDPQHMLKFILRELATSGNIEGTRAIFNGKFYLKRLQEKFELYVKEFIQCRECKSHDTQISKKDSFAILKCMACQATRTLPKVK